MYDFSGQAATEVFSEPVFALRSSSFAVFTYLSTAPVEDFVFSDISFFVFWSGSGLELKFD